MNSTPTDESIDPALPAEPLGRAWIGPGLLLAGLVALGRVEILARLAGQADGASQTWARWGVLADWPAQIIQGLVMGSVTAAVVWSTRGARRPLAILLGGAILTSALSGWPIAPLDEIPGNATPGLPTLWQIGLGCVLVTALVSVLADVSSRAPRLSSFLSARATLISLAVLGLGLPSLLLWRQSTDEPQMPVREVLAELDIQSASWKVVLEDAEHPARAEILSPFVDIRFNKAVHDTGDKIALLMSPPCEVEFEIPAHARGAALLLAAQIDGLYTDRGIDLPGRRRPSILDDRGLQSLSVKFEVRLDGETVFAETITHAPGESGAERVWRHVGAEGSLPVNPGQVVSLRTEFGDPRSAQAFAQDGLKCGFGGLVLERWREEPRRRSSAETPNILFVTIDTLRADRMSCYGYPKLTTPRMDALADSGLLFEHAFATSSWTWPSTASLFTGLLPYEHGVLSNSACTLNYSYETLAEVLQERGYTTAAISCNPLIDPTRQFDQGFEDFDSGPRMRMTDEVIDSIEAKIRELADTRFFLYLHLADPHTPHRPLPSELERLGGEKPDDFPDRVEAGIEVDGMDFYAGKLMRGEACDEFGVVHPERVVPQEHAQWMSDRYDASVGTCDHYVGMILDLLEELQLTQRTMVVITSDHGEELFDHGMLAHGHALWCELVHVPLIISGPDVPPGERITAKISNRHIAATLANVGGGELPQVQDRLSLLDPDFVSPTVFYQTSKGYWNGQRGLELLGLRDERFVVHFAPQGGKWDKPADVRGDARIFSSETDFAELTDLFLDPNYRRLVAPRVDAIQGSVQAQRERRQGRAVGIGAAGLRALKDLGYVGDEETLEDARGEGQEPPQAEGDEDL